MALAPPYWATAERIGDARLREYLLSLKIIYESAMLNGPFAILAACGEAIFSLTDNTKLRPMTVATTKDYSYFASEVSALYEMEENPERIFAPRAGQPYIVELNPPLEASAGGLTVTQEGCRK
jgi:glutamate synthase domain-containing protein 1